MQIEARTQAAVSELIFGRLFNIRPSERRRACILAAQLFAASGIFILGRTVRDTLFLSRYPVSMLPWMFVLYGIAAALAALLYARYAGRVSRSTLIHTTAGTGITTYVWVWFLVRGGASWVYPAFYVWTDVVANLFLVQFWTLASELDSPRDARRLNTSIGAARPFGVIFFSLVTAWIVPWLGTEQLLFVLAALMLAFSVLTRLLHREPRPDREREALERWPGQSRPAREVPYFRVLAGLILVMFIALTLGDYQFKVIAGAAFKEEALARFFAVFYGIVGILSVLFQLLLTPRILSRLGVGSALTVMPGVFGTSSLLLLLWPGLAAASALKFADNGLQFTLHDTTMQSLYAPFSPATRARMRGFLDGAVKPLSYGAGGLLLAGLLAIPLDVRQISFITVAVALLWQALVPGVRRQYLRSLEGRLAGPMAAQLFEEPFVLGSAERRILIHTLATPDPVRTLVALDQLQNETSEEFRKALAGLLHRPEGAVRARAIQVLERLEDSSMLGEFKAAARDPEPIVRAAAACAVARFISDEDPEPLYPFMDDPAREVRVGVLARLIRHGGLEGSTKAGLRLLELQRSERIDDRRVACAVLGMLGRSAYLSLRKLLEDPSSRVRRSALRASTATADPRLVPLAIRALYDPATRNAAMTALIAAGEPGIPFIDQALRDPALPRAVRLQLPRTLRRIVCERSLTVLEAHQAEPDSHVRLRVYASMGRLRAALRLPPVSIETILPRIKREVSEATGNLLSWEQACPRFETRLLSEEIAFRIRRSERRIMRLLEMCYDRRETSLVLSGLENPARRTEALETLEALVHPALRELILPLLERRISQSTTEPADVCILRPLEFMLLQSHHPNPYVAYLALDALSRAGESAALPAAQAALAHPDPLVREAGLLALLRLDPDRARALALAQSNDPDPAVARCALCISAAASRGLDMETAMHGTLEKILFLKATPLFSGLSSEDLAPLARVAEIVPYGPGATVFQEGVKSDHFFVVVSGRLAIECRGRELARVGPQGMVGELSVLDRGPQSMSVRALEESQLLRIGGEELFEILHEQPEISEALIAMLARQVRAAQEMMLGQAGAGDTGSRDASSSDSTSRFG